MYVTLCLFKQSRALMRLSFASTTRSSGWIVCLFLNKFLHLEVFTRAYTYAYIFVESRRQEGERFINYVDFFERLDSHLHPCSPLFFYLTIFNSFATT